jgi:para-nitrobenzyl esterase
MQRAIFGDMNFRSDGISEDCLYLNVWSPAKSSDERLPVLVYFYGGGFMAGDGSEPRYDGESMARNGIVALTVNYRLNIFGFFAHPELSKESPHKASGNYGLLDQAAALRWVQENIAAFGGDPDKVTIAGESAGSVSVSAQMVSPLSKGLIAGAIGESGSILAALRALPLKDVEQEGVKFAKQMGVKSLKELRALPADKLLEATANPETPRFSPTIDGYFFPQPPREIIAAGQQAQIPLLIGWNSEEMNARAILGQEEPTPENYKNAVQKLYGEKAEEVLKLYPGNNKEEILQAATDLAGDRFIGYSTWIWGELHGQTSDQPVYRYLYNRPRPEMRPEMGDATAGLAGGIVRGEGANKQPRPLGAVHSAEIEYAMGNLPTNRVYDWEPEDYKVSEIMQGFFVNFIKSGDPNGLGVPAWPAANKGDEVQVMHIDVVSGVKPEQQRERYEFLDKMVQ